MGLLGIEEMTPASHFSLIVFFMISLLCNEHLKEECLRHTTDHVIKESSHEFWLINSNSVTLYFFSFSLSSISDQQANLHVISSKETQ